MSDKLAQLKLFFQLNGPLNDFAKHEWSPKVYCLKNIIFESKFVAKHNTFEGMGCNICPTKDALIHQ